MEATVVATPEGAGAPPPCRPGLPPSGAWVRGRVVGMAVAMCSGLGLREAAIWWGRGVGGACAPRRRALRAAGERRFVLRKGRKGGGGAGAPSKPSKSVVTPSAPVRHCHHCWPRARQGTLVRDRRGKIGPSPVNGHMVGGRCGSPRAWLPEWPKGKRRQGQSLKIRGELAHRMAVHNGSLYIPPPAG